MANKPDVMIDIETLDVSPKAVVLSVGMCKFHPSDSSREPFDGAHFKLDIDTQSDKGRVIDDGTISWWATQPKEIQEAAFSEEGRVSVESCAKDINKYLVGVNKIWACGPDFDMVILQSLFTDFGLHCNWKFWQYMDVRTLFQMMPRDPRKDMDFDAHNALADAIAQSICVQKSYEHFKIKK